MDEFNLDDFHVKKNNDLYSFFYKEKEISVLELEDLLKGTSITIQDIFSKTENITSQDQLIIWIRGTAGPPQERF